VLGVVFPAFATSFVQDRERTALIFGRGVKYVFLILFPLTLATTVLAPEMLQVWLGPEFALQSTRVLQWLAIGVLLNGMSQVPSAIAPGGRTARPDGRAAPAGAPVLPHDGVVADQHARDRGGGNGLDGPDRTRRATLLRGGPLDPPPRAGRLSSAWPMALPPAVLLMVGCAAAGGSAVRFALLVFVAAVLVTIAWRRVLTGEEKRWIMGQTRPARGSRSGGHGRLRHSRGLLRGPWDENSIDRREVPGGLRLHPELLGGHALYARELLTALTEAGAEKRREGRAGHLLGPQRRASGDRVRDPSHPSAARFPRDLFHARALDRIAVDLLRTP